VRLTADDLDTLIDLCRLEASSTSSEEEQSVAIDLGNKLRELRDGPDPLADIHALVSEALTTTGFHYDALRRIQDLSKP